MAKSFEEFNKINEEGVAYAGTGSGMGAVVTATPASVPGATVTGDGTSGSGDIGVPYNVSTKSPANLNNSKKKKKEKKIKKYKFSDMIKFENFENKEQEQEQEQEELDKITSWLSGTSEELDDWDWDGDLLTIFNNGNPTEKYTRRDLEEEGVFENISMESLSSDEFQKIMDKISKTIKSNNNIKYKDWIELSERDLFYKLSVKNWKDAYEKNPSACIAYRSRLNDYFNKPEKSLIDKKIFKTT